MNLLAYLARPSLKMCRSLIPESLRKIIWRYVFGEEIYPYDYFYVLNKIQKASFPIMARSIINYFHPKSIIDVGCGDGSLLLELKRQGIHDLAGIEFSDAGIKRCRSAGLNVKFGNLSKSCEIDSKKHISICMEVAEHMEPMFADQIVRNLSNGPSLLVFSAATPGQGGHDHLNEQRPDYWIEKFSRVSFTLDSKVTEAIRREWSQENIAPWFSKNVMIFRRDCVDQTGSKGTGLGSGGSVE